MFITGLAGSLATHDIDSFVLFFSSYFSSISHDPLMGICITPLHFSLTSRNTGLEYILITIMHLALDILHSTIYSNTL